VLQATVNKTIAIGARPDREIRPIVKILSEFAPDSGAVLVLDPLECTVIRRPAAHFANASQFLLAPVGCRHVFQQLESFVLK
jgi:hypothetical protein